MLFDKKFLCLVFIIFIVSGATLNNGGIGCSKCEEPFRAQTIDEMTQEESLKRVRKSKSTVIFLGAAFLGVHAGRRDSLELYRKQHAIQKNARAVYEESVEDYNEIE
jgi:hypothetical protein